jgi:hypothetical protein
VLVGWELALAWQSVKMLVTPRPGVSMDNLIQDLQTSRDEAFNLRGGSGAGTAQIYLLDYLDWAGRAARTLGNQISEADLASLVLNRRYELLLSSFGTMASPLLEAQRVVRDLVQLELDERVKDLDAAITTLRSYKDRWNNVGDLVVLDTNFYVEHLTELKDTDLAAVTTAKTPGSMTHVLVPMLVVDELDRLKRDNQARSRARTALKMLDEVFKRVSKENSMGLLRREDNTTKPEGSLGLGRITMELLFDPPDHVRLPDNDAEIIDRAVAVQTLAGRPVTMVTYDKNMSLRARYEGLQEIWLPHPPGQEGEQPRSRRSRGRS